MTLKDKSPGLFLPCLSILIFKQDLTDCTLFILSGGNKCGIASLYHFIKTYLISLPMSFLNYTVKTSMKRFNIYLFYYFN